MSLLLLLMLMFFFDVTFEIKWWFVISLRCRLFMRKNLNHIPPYLITRAIR